ncbi:L-type lectin-domain containing receptor kinase IX.1-like [Prunus yedoensis var. nudiflora]|uniref:L-type lectin-domain containing receptor kinase IX.1-like n=1 Tax=Prunus yedoensis var. nudiflora TaxID=2094558 RepID=A0A314ZHL6_PRUYE|nr:L-type lectin-domain containing receptor kinase IX.1-like [Prunus yedoensis var. nudiflora]
MAILGLHYTLHNSDFFIIVATYISIIRCIADFHVLVVRIAMSLCRISTFRLQSLKNCSIVLFMFFNFFQPIVHPLSFSIKSFGRDANNILYEGDAEPSPYGVIEPGTITGAAMFHTSRATYAEPLHLWDSAKLADFTTNFSFVIDTYNKTVFADGLVFFIAPVHYPIPPNSAGAYLGLLNSTTSFEASHNQIVMVEFDTYSNEWDPPGPHVGININTISSVVSASWDARGNSGKMAHVQITYSATTKNLTVVWTYEKNTNVAISSLSYRIDLRKVLPEWVTIGFSTANGFSGERNAICTWDFSSNSDEISTKKKEEAILDWGRCTICWLVVKKRINRIDGHGNYSNSAASTDLERQALPRRFAYKELVAATNGFSNDRRLGQGGSGQVYKGIIQDLGCTVAVKRIFPESEHYESVFINEVKIISRLIHRNLVQFIGWCHEQGECLLVYAYMPNSSLDTHLFGSRATLQWDFRYKIALDLATALHYLHEDAEKCVLHRDIKSANILLDNDFKTKLGDFGIAKLVDPRFRTQSTGVVGTFGYIAPEYANGGRASKESDMYSFGVVALELACGRRTYQDEEFHVPLFRWVWQLYLAGNLLSAADERLDMNYVPNEMECLLNVGLWCTRPNDKERPKAGQVMKVLQLEAPLPKLPHDMHDYPQPQPQPQQQTGSSQLSLTSSFETVGH